MITKKFFKYVTMVAIGMAVLLPVRAFAISAADLLVVTDRAQKLCDAGTTGTTQACEAVKSYKIYLALTIQKPMAERDAYVKENVPSDLQGATYSEITDNYNKAVAAGKIEGADASSAGAETCGDVDVSIGVGCSGTGNPIYDYLRAIIKWLGGLIGLAVVVTLIVSGIQYASSAGNPQNIAKAKERVVNSVIGLVLYLFLAAILQYVIPGVFTS